MARTEFVLYTRPGCHLCDVAAEMLDSQEILWRAENIDRDLDLIRRYGDRVPVICRPDDGTELAWPFDATDLNSFLNAPRPSPLRRT